MFVSGLICILVSCISTEPTVLTGEGEYNLNVVKEVKVTDSYIGLDQGVRGCQTHETYDDCSTKQFLEDVQNNCGCIPFNIRLNSQFQVITLII